MPQGWRPEGLTGNPPAPEVTPRDVIRYDTRVPGVLDHYALAHFVAILPMTVGLMGTAENPPRAEVIIGAALVLWALLNLGGIFDHRRWAFFSEWLRLPATAAAVWARLPDVPWRMPAMAALTALVVGSWICLIAYRRVFDGAPQSPRRLSGNVSGSWNHEKHELSRKEGDALEEPGFASPSCLPS